MSHADELIRQIIRTLNLHNLYPGRDPSSFGDLFQIAWVQIESALYKFDCSPGHTKIFNLWSQIAKTVILAHIKREFRDKRHAPGYRSHLKTRRMTRLNIDDSKIKRFLVEARETFKFSDDYIIILDALEQLYGTDPIPHEGLIGKLVEESGLSRPKVVQFLKMLRLRSFEFTDSPINEDKPQEDKRVRYSDFESDDDD